MNGVKRIAEVVNELPANAVKITVENIKSYDFYEVVDIIGEDRHHWTYAVMK